MTLNEKIDSFICIQKKTYEAVTKPITFDQIPVEAENLFGKILKTFGKNINYPLQKTHTHTKLVSLIKRCTKIIKQKSKNFTAQLIEKKPRKTKLFPAGLGKI